MASPEGGWRQCRLKQFPARDKASLDIFWPKDESQADLDDLSGTDDLAGDLIESIDAGLTCFREVLAGLAAEVLPRTCHIAAIIPLSNAAHDS